MSDSRIVVVTGGSSGIGLETVRRLANRGDQVHTCSRTEFSDSWFAAGDRISNVHHQVLDVTRVADLTDWIQRIGSEAGRIDALVNNAAAVYRKPLEEFQDLEIRSALDVNLMAMLKGTQAALPFLRRGESPSLICLSSMAAVDPFEGFSIYGACKAFSELFIKALANEWRDQGISCFSIRAGAVETPLLRRVLPEFPADQAIAPADIAKLIERLVHQPDSFESGSAIEITRENFDQYEWIAND